MKKVLIMLCFLLSITVISTKNLEAVASTTPFIEGERSPKNNPEYDPVNSNHLGYYHTYKRTGNIREDFYSDIYIDNKFEISYAGVLSSPQSTLKRSLMYNEQVHISKLSFTMREEFTNTNSLSFLVTTNINDLSNSLGVTFTNTVRYSQGMKITVELPQNVDTSFVIMVLYKVKVNFTEIVYKTTRDIPVSINSLAINNDRPIIQREVNATIGYVATYAYIGSDSIPNYKDSIYLTQKDSIFNDTEKYIFK